MNTPRPATTAAERTIQETPGITEGPQEGGGARTDDAEASKEPPEEADIQDVGWASSETEGSDTEADQDAEPAGAGPKGWGPTLTVYKGRKRRAVQDGGGLCSLGRWPPERRPVCRHPRIQLLRAALRRELQDWQLSDGADLKQIFQAMCGDDSMTCPFPETRTARLLAYALQLYGDQACPRADDRSSPIRVRLLQSILRDADDPDHRGLETICQGVPIGVGTRLPRTPAVYARKRKWSLKGQEDSEAWRRPWEPSAWRANYASAEAEQEEVERQLEELLNEVPPKVIRFTEPELRARWPNAAVASLGALVKTAEDGTRQTRILYDGTRGVDINTRIRVRDKERGPTTGDIKAILREQSTRDQATVGVTVDVKSAHRLIPVREDDWQFQVCRARAGGPLYAFRCGVFGIASASYWWGRLAGAILRSIYHISDADHALWLLLVADDFKMESTATAPHEGLLFALWYLVLLNVPLRWTKTRGGEQLGWVGYFFDYRSHGIGLTESRAAWAVAWCRRQAQTGGGRLAELREGVGRLGFVVGALTYEAPFLMPLYAYMSLLRSEGFHVYPAFVRLTLHYLADNIQGCRTYSCAHRASAQDRGPRVDAMAEDGRIGLGGWLPTAGPSGAIDTMHSPWFSITLDRTTAPWAFTREGRPQRAIAALEAYATLMAVRAFDPWLQQGGRGTLAIRSYTDNQGNTYALGRLATTKYPLNCVVMELAAQLKARGYLLDLRWLPRELNQEADRLSKGQLQDFCDQHRMTINPADMDWLVLDRMMKLGTAFHQENQQLRAKLSKNKYAPIKRKRGQRLRDRDPW